MHIAEGGERGTRTADAQKVRSRLTEAPVKDNTVKAGGGVYESSCA